MRSPRRSKNESRPKKRLSCRIGEDGLRCDLSENTNDRRVKNESVDPGCYVDLEKKSWHCPPVPALHGRKADGVDGYQIENKFGQSWARVGDKKIPVAAFPVAVGRRVQGTKKMARRSPISNLLSRFGFGNRNRESVRLLPRTSEYAPCKQLKCPAGQHCKCTTHLDGSETCTCEADYTTGPSGLPRGRGHEISHVAAQHGVGAHTPLSDYRRRGGRRTVNQGRESNVSILLPALSKPGEPRSAPRTQFPIQSPLPRGVAFVRDPRFLIEGHTDRSGPRTRFPIQSPLPRGTVFVRDPRFLIEGHTDRSGPRTQFPIQSPLPRGTTLVRPSDRTLFGRTTRRTNPQRAFVPTPLGPSDPGSFVPTPPGTPENGDEVDCCYDPNESVLVCAEIPEADGMSVQLVTEFTYPDGRRGASVQLPDGSGIRVPICKPPVDIPPPEEWCCVDGETMVIVCATPSHPWHGVDVSSTGACYVDDNGEAQCAVIVGDMTVVLALCEPDDEPDDDPEPEEVVCCFLKSTGQIVCEDTSHQWHLMTPTPGTVTFEEDTGEGEHAWILAGGDSHLRMPVCPEEDPEEVPFDCCYLKSTREIICTDESHPWHRYVVSDENMELYVNQDGSEYVIVELPDVGRTEIVVCPEPEIDCPPGTRLDEHGRCVPPPSCPPGMHIDEYGRCVPPQKKPPKFLCPKPSRKPGSSKYFPKKKKKPCCDGCAKDKGCDGKKHG